ncbi:patatin-like protein 7 [Rutidosis leptorrhynchoides]|uniref:patatin-like protein 7 n=1 Tax=Rutidosis leptorrhynchoides TaxID=125765 RepID=UPI003A995838
MASPSLLQSNPQMDKLTSQIFSVLENNFLFPPIRHSTNAKIRILSIDGSGSTNGILAAKSILHLESTLRHKSHNPNAHISDFFDVVAGSGVGGVLATLLFTKGKNNRPLFTANEALKFVTKNGTNFCKQNIMQRMFKSRVNIFDKIFGDLTLKDTVKTVLIPCYDLTVGAPVVFSRADAVEMDGCDCKLSDVCAATTAVSGPFKTVSVDGRNNITAVGGDVAMNNPTAAAVTHVLYNRQEFPFVNGVEDLFVVSLGNGEPLSVVGGNQTPSRTALVKIVGEAVSDTVDQAVSMAFGQFRTTGYVRIQANKGALGAEKHKKGDNMLRLVDEMLKQQNVESVLFQGKRCNSTNIEKLEFSANELLKEKERRKTDMLPIVLLNQTTTSSSSRTSSATTLSTTSSSN